MATPVGVLRLTAAAGALVLAGVALPWAGWFGAPTYGFAVALAGVIALAAWAAGRARRGNLVALAAGLVAAAMLAARLVSTPDDPVLREVRSIEGLLLGLVASLLLVAAAAATLTGRAAPMTRRGAWLAPEQRRALVVTLRAVVVSRAIVWVAGTLAVVVFGIEETITRPVLAAPFGDLGNTLFAPANAWDAGSYLAIAQAGYVTEERLQAFFPLYPSLVRLAAGSPEVTLMAGIAVSLAAFAGALYLLHRLVSLELDDDLADRTVTLTAFLPMAFFFSAVYTESIFLLLSVGAFYAARRERWALAALAAGLAAASRPTGVLLLVPLAWLFVFGPGRTRWSELRSSARLDRRLWLLAIVPAGFVAFLVYSGLRTEFLTPLRVQEVYWGRTLVPFDGLVRGLRDGALSLHQLIVPGSSALPAPAGVGQMSVPRNLAFANLTDLAFLALAVGATVGVLRRLPIAYGLYCVATLVLTVSTSFSYQPLASAPRFLVVLFPCHIWLALRARETGWHRPVVIVSGLLLAFFTARFATWHWVA